MSETNEIIGDLHISRLNAEPVSEDTVQAMIDAISAEINARIDAEIFQCMEEQPFITEEMVQLYLEKSKQKEKVKINWKEEGF